MDFVRWLLTFESADEILWCDHSNESSLPALSHGAIRCLKFHKVKFGILVEIFGSGRVKVKYNVFFVVYKRQNLGSMRVCMFYFISFFYSFIADSYIIINFYSIILLENSNSETVGGLWWTLFDACSEWIAIVTEKQYLKT